MVYELDAPIVSAGSITTPVGASTAITDAVSATNPKAGQSVTEYQIYQTNSADMLTYLGTAQAAATSAAGAITTTSLGDVTLLATTPGADTIEVRAYNGAYWGDWSALSVTVTPAVSGTITVAQALATSAGSLLIADSAGAIATNADQLDILAASGRIAGISITSVGLISLTRAQLATDAALVKLLPDASVTVPNANVLQAAALQASPQVASFTVTDHTSNINAMASTLGQDSKLAQVTLIGSTNGRPLSLATLAAPVSLTLNGNYAYATAPIGTATPSFLGASDVITLGSGATTITAPLTILGGIDEFANFTFGLDELTLSLGGAASSVLKAYNETIGGQNAIAIVGASVTHGVILLDQPAGLTPSAFLASHVSFSNGNAVIQ